MPNRQRAYTDLLMRHRNMLWRLCWNRACGDRDRCQDLFQEVSIALWENHEKLRPDALPWQERAWVYWQARSVFYRIERRQKTATVPINEALADSVTDEESLHNKEIIEELMSTLSPDEQRMLQLHLAGYEGDEISNKMGVSRNTVYQRMRRAIQKMQRVALILVALLLTIATAVAVVPQWRKTIFKGGTVKETPIDTIAVHIGTQAALPAESQHDTITAIIDSASRPTPQKLEPIEPMPSLDPVEMISITDELPPPHLDDIPTIWREGSLLFITGAAGEIVRIYDLGGNLVAAKRATEFCFIDLYPIFSTYAGFWTIQGRHDYLIQIGSRPALRIQL